MRLQPGRGKSWHHENKKIIWLTYHFSQVMLLIYCKFKRVSSARAKTHAHNIRKKLILIRRILHCCGVYAHTKMYRKVLVLLAAIVVLSSPTNAKYKEAYKAKSLIDSLAFKLHLNLDPLPWGETPECDTESKDFSPTDWSCWQRVAAGEETAKLGEPACPW